MSEYVMHMFISPDAPARCGASDPGPIPWGQVDRVLACADCMNVDGGIPHEQTMRGHVERTRRNLARKLRGLSEADRADYKASIFSGAVASLVDPEGSPLLFDDKQLIAALYATGAVKAAFYSMKRSGVRPTWSMLETGVAELEMIIVALAEGTPQ